MNAIQHPNENTAPTASALNVLPLPTQKLIEQIANAKNAIRAEFLQRLAAHERLLRLALNEAEALAWQTAYPHLVFPVLATEKAQAVAAWDARQRLLRQTDPAPPLGV
jgi:hypothetical protein